MKQIFEKAAFPSPPDADNIKAVWKQQGFSFGIFRDPPNQEWNGLVHATDEYVLDAGGTLTISVGRETAECQPGDLVNIPRGVEHSLRTTSPQGSVWFYGYGFWGKDDG